MLGLLKELQPAFQRQDRARIVEIVGQLIAHRAPMGEQWQQLAGIAADLGETTLARRAIDLFIEAAGGQPAAKYHKFDLLCRIGALVEAQALLGTLPETVPDPAINAYSRGAVAAFLGQFEDARNWLERATRLQPAMGQVWLPISTLVDFAEEPELVERLLAAERNIDGAPPSLRAIYFYAQGKAYADLGEHTKAFAAFARGAKLKKSMAAYSRNNDRAVAIDAVRGYRAESIAAIAQLQREPTERSIFVTGLPRSGTTLVEQILASHSAVSGGAEINLMRLLQQEIGGVDYPTLGRYVARHGAATPARLWRHLLHERFPAPGRVVDKSLDGYYFLGIIAALLPEAPLIWLTRDPLDCAWSSFRTHFFAGLDWSYDLEDIAFHLALHDELLSRWQDILGDRLLVLPYESLVANPDEWIRRILVHCRLPEEPQVFAPHETPRSVTTSSLLQVRRPINRKGIGVAEPYREFLGPFVDAYSG